MIRKFCPNLRPAWLCVGLFIFLVQIPSVTGQEFDPTPVTPSQLLRQTEGGGETVGVIRMSDMATNEVLDMLERFTGKPIFRQQNLPAVKISFNSQGAMTKEQAILAIESLLSLNGVAITDVGDSFLKAVPAASVSTQVPRFLETSSLFLPPSQKIYTKFYQLDFLTTLEAIPLIQPLLSQGAPIAFEKRNSMLLTDALINLQRVERILAKVDQPADANMATLFFQLKHVAATEILNRLQSMQSGSLRMYLENNTTFDADDRTNQLIIFTHHSNEKLLSELVQKIDIDVAPITQTEIYHIKHADAAEVTTLIEQVITGQQRSRNEGQGRSNPKGARTPARQNQTEGPNSAATTNPNVSPQAIQAAVKNLQFSDHLTIVADPRGNSIVASGTSSDLVYLQDLIEKIDILLAQVRIEVVIMEVTLTDDYMRGIDALSGSFNLDGLEEIHFDVDGPSTSRLNQAYKFTGSVKEFSISGLLNTAKRNAEVTVLSSPTIMTTHNQEATISVVESRPVITASQTDSSVTSSLRSSVQFKDIGIELKVKPLISLDGIIQMEIDQKVESVVGTVTIDSNEQPIIGKRQATSFVSVADGDLIVLGGLQELNTTESKGRMGLLGQIPLLGAIFSSKTNEETRRELLIFIRPKIIQDTKEAHVDTIEKIKKSDQGESLNQYLEDGEFEKKEKKKKKKFLGLF